MPDNAGDNPKPKSFLGKFNWGTDLLAPDRRAASHLSKNPFGWPLLDLCLKLALFYPIWILFAASVALNIDAQMGAFNLLPKDSPIWFKLVLAYALVAMILVQFKPFEPWQSSIRFSFLLVLLLALLFTGAGTGTGAFAVAFVGAFAVVVVVAFAVAFAGAGALVTMLAYCTRHKKPFIGFSFYFGVIIGALMITASLSVPRSDAENEVMTSLFIFFGVLPLCNALFDYVSLGLTRWLLRQGATNARSAVLFGCIDLIAAAIAFTALGCTLIGFIHLLNLVAVQPFFDFAPLFEGLKDPSRWREHIWIYAMIFSTFVPTFIHFGIACFSLVTWTPNQLKDWILEGLTSGETIAISGGVFALSALVSFVIVGPLWLVIFVSKMLLAHYPIIGITYLGWFESFARLIGAIA